MKAVADIRADVEEIRRGATFRAVLGSVYTMLPLGVLLLVPGSSPLQPIVGALMLLLGLAAAANARLALDAKELVADIDADFVGAA